MDLAHSLRVGALLANLARSHGGRGGDPRIEERLDQRTPGGASYDLYQPRGAARATVVGLHGVATTGRRHPRLILLARALASLGVRCAVPQLPGLAACRWDPDDLGQVVEVVDEVATGTGQRPGIGGFSYGASYGLLAAVHPRIAERVRFVFCIGAYASLPPLLDWYRQERTRTPRSELEWDDTVYLELILALQSGVLSGEAQREGSVLLQRYCSEASAVEKRQFYERHLRGREVLANAFSNCERTVLEALSPAGKLSGLRCPVTLIHDPADTLVPSGHSQQLYDELAKQPGGERHRLLLSRLINHVAPSELLDFRGLLALGSAFASLVDAT